MEAGAEEAAAAAIADKDDRPTRAASVASTIDEDPGLNRAIAVSTWSAWEVHNFRDISS